MVKAYLPGAVYTAPIWLVFCLLGYWVWLDYLPMNPLGGPGMTLESKAIEGEAKAGEFVTIEWHWEILRDCPRLVELFLDNGHSRILSSHRGSTRGEGPRKKSIVSRVKVPAGTEAGAAALVNVAHFNCNPMRTWTIRHKTPITILEAQS